MNDTATPTAQSQSTTVSQAETEFAAVCSAFRQALEEDAP